MADIEVYHVELELGREPQHPFGERGRLYYLHLPLKADGSLDAQALRKNDVRYRGRRLCAADGATDGRILPGTDGSIVFEWDDTSLRQSRVMLNANPLVVGKSVAVTEANRKSHQFQVISVRHV